MSQILSRRDRELSIELADAALSITAEVVGADSEAHERSLMLASQFIEQCGFDLLDSDQIGYEMGEIAVKRLAESFLMIGLDSVMEAML
jgi:hypothetical protein